MYYNFTDSPVGNIGIVYTDFDIHRLIISVRKKEYRDGLEDEFSNCLIFTKNDIFDRCASEINEYFAGKRKKFTVPFSLTGTDFQKRVWLETEKVPYGETTTYGELARRINNPKAARAVGNALHNNTLQLLIPCHRVVAKNGNLTGFKPSINIKKYLLTLEGALLATTPLGL